MCQKLSLLPDQLLTCEELSNNNSVVLCILYDKSNSDKSHPKVNVVIFDVNILNVKVISY